jgi:uncharacterized protein (TIGR02266 family)
MVSSADSLHKERAQISDQVVIAQQEAHEIRNQLQSQQEALSQAEAQLSSLHESLEEVRNLKVEILTQESQLEQELEIQEQALVSLQKNTAVFAQQLAPTFQKQKRFEEALAMIDQKLAQLPNDSSLRGLGGLPKPGGLGNLPKPGGLGNLPKAGGLGGLPKAGGLGGLPKPGGLFGLPKAGGLGGLPKAGGLGGLPKPSGLGGLSPQNISQPSSNSFQESTQASTPPVLPPATPPLIHTNSASISDASQRAPRVSLNIELQYELNVNRKSTHNFYTGFTNNISEGGLFIATEELIEIGSRLTFQFCLPSMDDPRPVEGIVRWVRERSHMNLDLESGMGVQFINLDPSLQQQINQFINQRDSIFYDE